ncbi:DUF4352 domain-containing protein [Streptomyces sp. NPDC096080]|uniref:DUF4352 domain-containing protein n=1 Tax=Streptomyces sp. NPDC096080 TaxID=3156693 RepID=UPI00332EE126
MACNPATSSVQTDPKASPHSGSQKATPKASAKVGDTLTLHGSDDGSQLDVTLKRWTDRAVSADEYSGPESGHRWVAAQFELLNTGKSVYADSPSNGATVLDKDGQRFDPAYGDITAGPSMTTSAKVPPGGKALGWIVFEVPTGVKVSDVQFTMDSGFADESGQWKIS